MATSSLKKSFVINSKKEATTFVKLFVDSMENTPEPIKRVNVSSIPREKMIHIINAKFSKNN